MLVIQPGGERVLSSSDYLQGPRAVTVQTVR